MKRNFHAFQRPNNFENKWCSIRNKCRDTLTLNERIEQNKTCRKHYKYTSDSEAQAAAAEAATCSLLLKVNGGGK